MRTRRHVASLFVGAALVLGARAAHADPIVITGGSAFLYWDASWSSGSYSGAGFRLVSDHTGGGHIGYVPGSTTTLDGNLSLAPFSSSAGGMRPITVNGTDYWAHVVGNMFFRTPAFVVPHVPPGTTSSLTAPFVMTGRIRGFAEPSLDSALLFDVEVFGTGTAVSGVSANNFGTFMYTGGVNYTFEDTAPTPEPATMLLLGTGAGIVALRARRRREQ